MSAPISREQRRYRAAMPQSAWQHGHEPRLRRRKRDAYADLAAGLQRYLARGPAAGNTGDWTAWALRLGAGHPTRPAPDATSWTITTRIDYL